MTVWAIRHSSGNFWLKSRRDDSTKLILESKMDIFVPVHTSPITQFMFEMWTDQPFCEKNFRNEEITPNINSIVCRACVGMLTTSSEPVNALKAKICFLQLINNLKENVYYDRWKSKFYHFDWVKKIRLYEKMAVCTLSIIVEYGD